jgi:deoxyribose-phosphate aldolase
MAYLESEIGALTGLAKKENVLIKLILETGILTDEEIKRCCQLYRHFPVDFLKTSTGYAEKGATVEAVHLLRKNLPDHIQIKASGGIRTYEFAKSLLDAGATRLGCSASVAIVTGEPVSNSGY